MIMSMIQCPICQSNDFIDFNNRKKVRCVNCLSVERTRLLWMVLERLEVFKPEMRILHFAPEFPLIRKFRSLSKDLYHPCDLDPKRYNSKYCKIFKIDICEDLKKMPSDLFDIIIHNHVLEHICCSVEDTLIELERVTKKGGHHFFTVPFRGNITRENISSDLSDEQRKKLFEQEDHVRLFGKEDFPDMVRKIWKNSEVTVSIKDLFSEEEIKVASIPLESLNSIDANTIFHHIKS